MNIVRKISVCPVLASLLFACLRLPSRPPETEEQKTLYAIGLIIARQLGVFNLAPGELDWVKAGLTDAATGGKPAVDVAAYNDKVQELAKARRKVQGDKQAVAGKEFLDKGRDREGSGKDRFRNDLHLHQGGDGRQLRCPRIRSRCITAAPLSTAKSLTAPTSATSRSISSLTVSSSAGQRGCR